MRTTPEKIWQAITDPKVTRTYWYNENISDWKPGSNWEHRSIDDKRQVLLMGKVEESKRPNRLVLWWVAPADIKLPNKYSRVSFDIEPLDEMVRLTVTHDNLEPGSDMETGINEGWPRVLSSMKSFLETGRALPTWFGHKMPATSEA
jgi:uncharacterized protein YndB with AHSA1/START domain